MKRWCLEAVLALGVMVAVMPGMVLADGLPVGSDPAASGVDVATAASGGGDVTVEPSGGIDTTVPSTGGDVAAGPSSGGDVAAGPSSGGDVAVEPSTGGDVAAGPSSSGDVAAGPSSSGDVAVVAGGVAQATAGGLTLPAADPVLAFVAPNPDQPNYAARLSAFLQATVPEVWNGQPVGFLSALNDAGGVAVLGLPTSSPVADPHNPNFVYQRFQNGVLFYNATDASIQALGL